MWVASPWVPGYAWLGEEIETERRKFEVLREEKAEMEMENEPWTVGPWRSAHGMNPGYLQVL